MQQETDQNMADVCEVWERGTVRVPQPDVYGAAGTRERLGTLRVKEQWREVKKQTRGQRCQCDPMKGVSL